MGQRAARLKKLADAAGPLYKSLDDGQKHRFVMLARLDGRRSAAASAVIMGSAAGTIAGRAGWQGGDAQPQ